jgi:hypothetical protein
VNGKSASITRVDLENVKAEAGGVKVAVVPWPEK